MIDVCARTSPGARIGFRRLLCGLGLALALLTAAGCHTNTFTPGTTVVTMSAKPGPFTSYIVNLDQIFLTRQDGNTAPLPITVQRIDLAHLDRITNLIEAPPVVVGTYVSVTFVLDYSGSYITVDINGATTVAPAIDPATSAGATGITVTVQFDPNHPLVINNPHSAPLAFVIDLEASNLLTASTTTGTGWQTIVKPFWTASTTPVYNTPIFARGDFVTTDTTDPKNNNFVLNTRPFRATLLGSTPNGALTVSVDDHTYYQVNGTPYVGARGLAALAALQTTYANLPVGAYSPNTASPFGSLSTITPSMYATEVYVGSSLESPIEDQISGIVSAVNSDGSLNMTDVAYIDRTGTMPGYSQLTQLLVDTATVVRIDGVSNVTPSKQSISVGQFLNATGVATAFDAFGNPTVMDATGATTPGAQVRLQNTTLWGTLNSATPGTAYLNLQSVENVLAPTFIPTANNYQVGTGSIDESVTAANTLLKVDGLAAPLNTTPPFTASAVTVPVNSQLVLAWPNGNTSGTINVSGSQVTINTADANLASPVIRTGPVTTVDLQTQPPPGNVITLTYNTTDPANPPLYGVGSVVLGESLFSDPNAFANKAASLLTNAVFKLVATGQYDANTGTFNATGITMNAK